MSELNAIIMIRKQLDRLRGNPDTHSIVSDIEYKLNVIERFEWNRREKPKKKVVLYQWFGKLVECEEYHVTNHFSYQPPGNYKRLDDTKMEVEVDE